MYLHKDTSWLLLRAPRNRHTATEVHRPGLPRLTGTLGPAGTLMATSPYDQAKPGLGRQRIHDTRPLPGRSSTGTAARNCPASGSSSRALAEARRGLVSLVLVSRQDGECWGAGAEYPPPSPPYRASRGCGSPLMFGAPLRFAAAGFGRGALRRGGFGRARA